MCTREMYTSGAILCQLNFGLTFMYNSTPHMSLVHDAAIREREGGRRGEGKGKRGKRG